MHSASSPSRASRISGDSQQQQPIKDEIAEALIARGYLGFSLQELKAIWTTTGEVILNEMLKGKAVTVSPFGVFTFSEERVDMGTQGVKIVRKPCFVMAPSYAKKHSILPINKRPVDSIKAHPLSHGQIAILAPGKIDQRSSTGKLNRNTVLLVLNQYFNIIGDRCKNGDRLEIHFGPLGVFLFGLNRTRGSYFLFSEELMQSDLLKNVDIEDKTSYKSKQKEYEMPSNNSTPNSLQKRQTPEAITGGNMDNYDSSGKYQYPENNNAFSNDEGYANENNYSVTNGIQADKNFGNNNNNNSNSNSNLDNGITIDNNNNQNTPPNIQQNDLNDGMFEKTPTKEYPKPLLDPERYIDRVESERESLANTMAYRPSSLNEIYNQSRRKDLPDDGTPNRVRTAASDRFDDLYRQYFDEEIRNIKSSNDSYNSSCRSYGRGFNRSPLLLTSKGKTYLGRGRLPIGSLAMTDGIRECPYCYSNPGGSNGSMRDTLPLNMTRSKSSTSIQNRFGFATQDPEMLEYAEYLRAQTEELKREDDEKRREKARIANEQARYNLSIADKIFKQKCLAKSQGMLNPNLEPMTDVFEKSEAEKINTNMKNLERHNDVLLEQINQNAAQKELERTQTLEREKRDNDDLMNALRRDKEKEMARNEATKRALSDLYSTEIEKKRQRELELRKNGKYESVYADKEGRGPLKWRTAPESREFHRRQMESLRKVMDEETRRFVKRKQKEEREKQLEKMHKTDVLSEIKREEDSAKKAEQLIKSKYARELEEQMKQPRTCVCPKYHGSCYAPIATEDQLADLEEKGILEKVGCDECGHSHYEVAEHNQ